jgi:putative nucleotidyltransferase with HDIG domain
VVTSARTSPSLSTPSKLRNRPSEKVRATRRGPLTLGADTETVVAALLHDVGQFLPYSTAQDMISNGISVGRKSHEAVGAAYLRELGFPEKVCELVGAHVVAKRYAPPLTPVKSELIGTKDILPLPSLATMPICPRHPRPR